MTEKKTVEIVFILDKSGSMESHKRATISGFNEYMGTLKKDKKTDYIVSLTLFDTVVKKLYKMESISEIDPLTERNYKPSGSTALYDAAMSTIIDAEQGLDKKTKILCVIMTDGEENSSKEYTENHFRSKVKELEAKGNWTFVYLGANQDAYAVAQRYGINVMNTVTFNATDKGQGAVFTAMSMNTQAYAESDDMQSRGYFTKAQQKKIEDTE